MIMLRIGDTVPRGEEQSLVLPGPVQWFGFVTAPQSEAKARAWLRRRGVVAWYPTERIWRVRSARRVKVPRYRVVVPRYVFARFAGEPRWHLVRACPWLHRVIGFGDRPLPISDATMGRMAEVPRVLREIRRREEEARRVAPGDSARIVDGPLAGWVVDVSEVRAGVARFLAPGPAGLPGEISVARLEKAQAGSGHAKRDA